MVNPYEPARDPAEFEKTALIEESPQSAETRSLLTGPLSVTVKSLVAYAGIVVPVLSFFTASGGVPDGPDWQTGVFGDKLSFALSAYGGYVVYPFVFIATGCFASYLIYDKTKPTRTGVRIVLLGGVLLSLFYTILLWLVLCETVDQWFMLAACQVGIPVIVVGLPMLARRLPFRWNFQTKLVLLGLLLSGIAASSILGTGREFRIVFFATLGLPIISGLFCGPVWALLAYGFVSLRIANDRRPSPPTGQLDWLAGLAFGIPMLVAMPLSIRLSWMHYATLPTEPPVNGCFVVTAAARGHRGLVGSWTETHKGRIVIVNHQLRRLRLFEQRLFELWPRTHGWLRRIYNRVGPRMANMLGNRWLADLAYISLKPLEWCAVAFLKVIDCKNG